MWFGALGVELVDRRRRRLFAFGRQVDAFGSPPFGRKLQGGDGQTLGRRRRHHASVASGREKSPTHSGTGLCPTLCKTIRTLLKPYPLLPLVGFIDSRLASYSDVYFDCLSRPQELCLMLIAQPLPFPRYFFQSLQVTNIKLAISPQPKVQGEPVTVSLLRRLWDLFLKPFPLLPLPSLDQALPN